MCSDQAPCKTLADGIGTQKSIVKMEGAISANDVTSIDGIAVQIYADPGTTLTCTKAGAVTLEIKNDKADVSIYDLEITGATGSNTDTAVSLTSGGTPKLNLTRVKIDHNVGNGIVATSGTLTVSQSTISNNGSIGISTTSNSLTMSQSTISNNLAGGISVVGTGPGMDAEFDLTNNFITGNGAVAATFGGVFIDRINSSKRRFEFNTIAGNVSMMPSGLRCTDMVSADVTFSNNIIFSNLTAAGSQIEGMHCNWTYSDIQATNLVSGTGNKNVDPMFLDPVHANYHLMPGSPLKDMADTAATLSVDFDGDPRPQGKADIGADEIIATP